MDQTRIAQIDTMDPALRKALSKQDKLGYVVGVTGLSVWYVQLYPWDDPVPVARFYQERRKNRKPRKPPELVYRCPDCGKRESRCRCS